MSWCNSSGRTVWVHRSSCRKYRAAEQTDRLIPAPQPANAIRNAQLPSTLRSKPNTPTTAEANSWWINQKSTIPTQSTKTTKPTPSTKYPSRIPIKSTSPIRINSNLSWKLIIGRLTQSTTTSHILNPLLRKRGRNPTNLANLKK